MRSLSGRQLFAAVVFVSSTVVLAVQLINPSPVVVSVGDGGTNVAELGGYFRHREVAIIAVAATLLGSSGTYLLVADRSGTETDVGSVRAGADPGEPTAGVEQAAVEAASTPAAPSADGGDSEVAPSDELLEARRQEWEETAERLANNERDIYEAVLEADGVLPQSEIVDQLDCSKATVSRALDSLETKNLVERKRRGMGNVILLL